MAHRLFLAGLLVLVAACSSQSESELVQDARTIVGDDAVVLLSASWCGYCRQERADLKRWGIPFTEFDIETEFRGRDAYKLLGRGGIPVTLIGQKRVRGWTPRYRKLIDAELNKHNDS